MRIAFIVLYFLSFGLFGQSKIKLKKIFVNNIEKTATDTIKLAPLEQALVFEFEVNHNQSFYFQFTKSANNSNWIFSRGGYINIANIEGGESYLKIKDSENGLISNFIIQKEAVFWQKWWFWPMILFYGFLIFSIGFYLFLQYNFRQKLKVLNLRNQIAADLHDEVGSNLSSITIFAQILKKEAPASLSGQIDRIIINARESVSLMKETIWSINPNYDSIETLFLRMELIANQLLEPNQIKVIIIKEGVNETDSINMLQRKNSYMIFKEAINNIRKHSEATLVKISLLQKSNTVEIKIEDNGKGFIIVEQNNGNGLVNFKRRAEEADMKIEMSSIIGKGTALVLKI